MVLYIYNVDITTKRLLDSFVWPSIRFYKYTDSGVFNEHFDVEIYGAFDFVLLNDKCVRVSPRDSKCGHVLLDERTCTGFEIVWR